MCAYITVLRLGCVCVSLCSGQGGCVYIVVLGSGGGARISLRSGQGCVCVYRCARVRRGGCVYRCGTFFHYRGGCVYIRLKPYFEYIPIARTTIITQRLLTKDRNGRGPPEPIGEAPFRRRTSPACASSARTSPAAIDRNLPQLVPPGATPAKMQI